jgi:hypothetical protein
MDSASADDYVLVIIGLMALVAVGGLRFPVTTTPFSLGTTHRNRI